MYSNHDKLEKLKSLVGEKVLETALKKVAYDALNSGNWYKVMSIAEFALKELHNNSSESLRGLETRKEIRARSRATFELEFPGDD